MSRTERGRVLAPRVDGVDANVVAPVVLGMNHLEFIGSMVLLYVVTWIPSIYPSHVSIPAP